MESLTTKMFAAGVNHVNMVEFQTTEFKRLREQARELALKAAREKAQKMAAVLGCTIGKPLSVSESDAVSSYWSSWIDWDGAATSLTMSQNKDRDSRAAGGGDTESMALGKISIRASVSVEFELKDN